MTGRSARPDGRARSLARRIRDLPSPPAPGSSAPADLLREYLAQLDAEAVRLRSRISEIEKTRAIVRDCLALLPDVDAGPFDPPSGDAVESHESTSTRGDPGRRATAVVRSAAPGASELPPLTAHLLGEFRLFRGSDELAPTGGPKLWRIVKFLMVRDGGPVSRDVLADVFWRDADPRAAAQSVYSAAHEIRRLLGGASDDDYLRCEGGFYELAPGVELATDVAHFRRRLSEGRRAVRRGRPAEAIRAFEDAVSSYAGPFLENEPYQRWAVEERELLATLHLALLEELASLHEEAGDGERSADLYRTILRHDPLREQVHRALIEHLAREGRRALALRQYEELKKTLRRELGIEPEAEVRELVRRIREG